MDVVNLLVEGLSGSMGMLKMHLGDFSDADFLTRPVPHANHTAWQLGHLTCAEANLLNSFAPGAIPAPPADFAAKFAKDTASLDDSKSFPSKAEIISMYEKVRADTITWTKSLTPADLDKPGPEKMARFAPTVGRLLAMLPVHDSMHLGQIQVIRRALGKPVIF